MSTHTNRMPQDLINAKPAAAGARVLRFLASFSQFRTITIIRCSEITPKSPPLSLGPGRLSARRAGFEVRVGIRLITAASADRDAGRPEHRPVNSLALTRASQIRLRRDTLIGKSRNGPRHREVVYLSAMERGLLRRPIPPCLSTLRGRFTERPVICRSGLHPATSWPMTPPRSTTGRCRRRSSSRLPGRLIRPGERRRQSRADVLEHQRRRASVRAEAAVVGKPAWEAVVARDFRLPAIAARRTGVNRPDDAPRIVIRATRGSRSDQVRGVRYHRLMKYQRSNQSTCIQPASAGEWSGRRQEGRLIADVPSTDLGELALVANVLVAFMPLNC